MYICIMDNTCIREEADVLQINGCRSAVEGLDESFEWLAGVLQLAGNKVRLKILFLLSREDALCVCDLSDILSMNVSAVSQHLRKLRDRHIIIPNRVGQSIHYTLSVQYLPLLTPFFELIEKESIISIST